MDGLNDVQHFVDHCRNAQSLSDIKSLLGDMTAQMGFHYYALVQHVDVRMHDPDSVIWMENYPRSWAEVFVETGLYANDPINLASYKTSVGFLWSDVARMIEVNEYHRAVLSTARREGMGDGMTVPIHIPGESNGSCNFAVRDGHDLPIRRQMMAQLVGSHAYESSRLLVARTRKATPAERPRLSPRQLDCLRLIAKGNTDRQIAALLGLKEDTVREYVEDARHRYGVSRRTQLLLRAIHDGHMTLADALL